MQREMRWYDHITINIYWLGLNVAVASLTPVILPFLVAFYVPAAYKNTYLATVRVVGLAVAMMIQPMAGMLSDRSTSRWGRRRPFIYGGTLFDMLFLLVIGLSPLFVGSALDGALLSAFGVNTAYTVLLLGTVLMQFSSNFAHGALQGLIPDLVPQEQRGRSSGVKAVMELLPIFLALGIGPLLDAGLIWVAIGVVVVALLATMLITLFFVDEEPLKERPTQAVGGRLLRLVALTAIFVATTRGAVWLVGSSGTLLAGWGATVGQQVAVVGLAGLVGMAGSIFLGVYLGAWVGIGRQAPRQRSFIWWVINRLLFLAAVGSIQGFAQYYLSDVIHIKNAATATAILMAAVALFLIPSALGGGYLADRIGRRRLVALSGLIGALGTVLLLFSTNLPLVILSGCIIGLGAGTFMATNWALGTDLVPPEEAGRYLGISNLAGAGAGIVGAGIGGPMADFFNGLRPGLGYLVIFGIYGGLFLLSIAALTRVKGR